MNLNKYLIKSFISKNSIFILCFFYSFLIQIIFSQSVPDSGGIYLKTFELKDGNNILLCTEKGIYLHDKTTGNFETKKKFEKSIELQEFNFVTIEQFDDGNNYIIVLYKDMIYIFTQEGKLFAEGSVNIDTNGIYFDLVPYTIKINNNNSNDYSFIVCYLKSSKFNIKFFSFNNKSGNIEEGAEISLSITNRENIFSHAGFSCQLMNSKDYDKVLTCFMNNNNYLVIESYSLINFEPINSLSYKSEDNNITPYYIYSVASKDKTQTLFCYLKGWSIARCDKYNIYKNTYTTVLYEETGNSCNNNYPSTSMIYTSTGENEFIYACKGTNNDFNLYQFNKDFELENKVNNYNYKINNCDTAYTITLIESINDKNKLNLITSCKDQSLLSNDVPETIQHNNDSSPYPTFSPTNSLATISSPTTSLPTTELPTTSRNDFVDTTNLSKETAYLTNFEEETTNINQAPNKIYSTQLVMPSTDI